MVITFLQSGQNSTLHNTNCYEFAAKLEDLEEHRGSRITYYQEVLEIRMPFLEIALTPVITT